MIALLTLNIFFSICVKLLLAEKLNFWNAYLQIFLPIFNDFIYLIFFFVFD